LYTFHTAALKTRRSVYVLDLKLLEVLQPHYLGEMASQATEARNRGWDFLALQKVLFKHFVPDGLIQPRRELCESLQHN
jgi:hypothetical protein